MPCCAMTISNMRTLSTKCNMDESDDGAQVGNLWWRSQNILSVTFSASLEYALDLESTTLSGRTSRICSHLCDITFVFVIEYKDITFGFTRSDVAIKWHLKASQEFIAREICGQ